MSDGDILRRGIPPQYCDAYQQMCDDVSPSACARTLANGLRKQLRYYRSGPTELLKRMSIKFAQLMQQHGPIQPRQWVQMLRDIEQERRALGGYGHRDGLDIASDICKRVLVMIEQGDAIDDIDFLMMSLYVREVLDRTYDSRVRSILSHFNEVPEDIVQDRRSAIQNKVEKDLVYFAQQLIRYGGDHKLRFAPKAKDIGGLDDEIE